MIREAINESIENHSIGKVYDESFLRVEKLIDQVAKKLGRFYIYLGFAM